MFLSSKSLALRVATAQFILPCLYTHNSATHLCKTASMFKQPIRGKKKKRKSNANIDSSFDKSIQEKALNDLYERNIMDRSHLENLIFEELSDMGLPSYENVVLRFVSPDLQRVESYNNFFKKFCPEDFHPMETYAIPNRVKEISVINVLNEKVLESVELEEFTRIVVIPQLSAVSLPLLLNLLKTTAPEGLKIEVGYFNDTLKWERFTDPMEIPENIELYGDLVDNKK